MTPHPGCCRGRSGVIIRRAEKRGRRSHGPRIHRVHAPVTPRQKRLKVACAGQADRVKASLVHAFPEGHGCLLHSSSYIPVTSRHGRSVVSSAESAQPVHHGVQPPHAHRPGGLIPHDRLGVIAHRQSGHTHHAQIVGTVPDGDGLRGRAADLGAALAHGLRLEGAIDDRPQHRPVRRPSTISNWLAKA